MTKLETKAEILRCRLESATAGSTVEEIARAMPQAMAAAVYKKMITEELVQRLVNIAEDMEKSNCFLREDAVKLASYIQFHSDVFSLGKNDLIKHVENYIAVADESRAVVSFLGMDADGLADFICDADSAISYWGGLSWEKRSSYELVDLLKKGHSINVISDDDEHGSFSMKELDEALEKAKVEMSHNCAIDNYDAELLDYIIQVAAFGDLIYG